MRGCDYGTNEPQGIALLLATPLTSERAFVQALGRVGRYGSRCNRFILARAKEHDHAELAE